MSSAKVEFWSDHIDAPKTVYRNLSDKTIERRMIGALEQHNGDGDLWAARTVFHQDCIEEAQFCFTKIGGCVQRDL
jgi:ribosomal protein S18 acetylase RimI-like enzyme